MTGHFPLLVILPINILWYLSRSILYNLTPVLALTVAALDVPLMRAGSPKLPVPQRRSRRDAVNAEVYKEDDAASYVKK